MRPSSRRPTAIRGSPPAADRRAGRPAFSRMWRPAPRFRAHLLFCLPSRLAARVLVQGSLFLPKLPPEARSRLGRLGGGDRPRPRAARQYVFTVPRILRPIFSRRRGLLGGLCHIVKRLLIAAYSGARVESQPGLILFIQTFGDLVTFNPHVHVLAADGVFRPDGVF